MFPIPHLYLFLSYLFIVVFMFWIGLRTPPSEAMPRGKDFSLLLKALIANVVLVPIAGYFIWRMVPMAPDIGLGFFLIAITPGGLFGLHFAHLAKGNIAFGLKLGLFLVFAAIVSVPLIVKFLFPLEVSVKSLDHKMFLDIVVYILLPVFLGQWVRYLFMGKVKTFVKILEFCIPVLYIAPEIVSDRIKHLSLDSVGHPAVLAFVLLIISAWVIGWCLGGPQKTDRMVVAIDTSMRNVAICWLLFQRSFADVNVEYSIVAFNAISIPMNFIFCIFLRFFVSKNKKKT